MKGVEDMKVTMLMGAVVGLTFLGTGCIATHKYVAKSIEPVETRVTGTEGRVTGTEAKNTEQDTKLASHSKEIEDLDTDLSRTKERLTDTDAKAVAAGQAARQADQKAVAAGSAAEGANKAAGEARTFASNGLNQLSHTVDAMNKYQMTKSETVLFGVNRWALTDDEKAKIDEFAKSANGLDRYVIEVQGFTDKTGPASYNETLSQERAEAVARYLINEHKIPVRSISMVGSGWAQPVADDKTRDGRKQNRRVEVRLFVPEASSASQGLTQSSQQ
jgi:outer membrane protein OmpA-like peptidoglycan-associated protein